MPLVCTHARSLYRASSPTATHYSIQCVSIAFIAFSPSIYFPMENMYICVLPLVAFRCHRVAQLFLNFFCVTRYFALFFIFSCLKIDNLRVFDRQSSIELPQFFHGESKALYYLNHVHLQSILRKVHLFSVFGTFTCHFLYIRIPLAK